MSPLFIPYLELLLFWVKMPFPDYTILIPLVKNIACIGVCKIKSCCSRPGFQSWGFCQNTKANGPIKSKLAIGLTSHYIVRPINEFCVVYNPSISFFPFQDFQRSKVPEYYFCTWSAAHHQLLLLVNCNRENLVFMLLNSLYWFLWFGGKIKNRNCCIRGSRDHSFTII